METDTILDDEGGRGMMRRMFWFVLGAVTGAYATVVVKRKIVDLGQRLTLANVLQALIDAVKHLLDLLLELWKNNLGSTRSPDAPVVETARVPEA